ncbi:hypothetical protein BJ138DRAFT_559038 [Hygrophoropsis aurantiaca]|uniref:Uncharacterized protein n=1 Tax=Hygrophoropsis aurantiaca TaxID=72124 RepID=A0ACB8A0S2_9AGAM|nr:hypothetical protein BJ138DRAFT_559038 [Hygrophoropsis aurantiaca]
MLPLGSIRRAYTVCRSLSGTTTSYHAAGTQNLFYLIFLITVLNWRPHHLSVNELQTPMKNQNVVVPLIYGCLAEALHFFFVQGSLYTTRMLRTRWRTGQPHLHACSKLELTASQVCSLLSHSRELR